MAPPSWCRSRGAKGQVSRRCLRLQLPMHANFLHAIAHVFPHPLNLARVGCSELATQVVPGYAWQRDPVPTTFSSCHHPRRDNGESVRSSGETDDSNQCHYPKGESQPPASGSDIQPGDHRDLLRSLLNRPIPIPSGSCRLCNDNRGTAREGRGSACPPLGFSRSALRCESACHEG